MVRRIVFANKDEVEKIVSSEIESFAKACRKREGERISKPLIAELQKEANEMVKRLEERLGIRVIPGKVTVNFDKIEIEEPEVVIDSTGCRFGLSEFLTELRMKGMREGGDL